MAVTADKVVVELELRDGQYLARVRQNERAFTQAQGRVAQSAEQAERRVRAASAGISSALRAAAAGIAAGVSVAAVKNLADSYTQLQNRLKVTGLEGQALTQQYERLNQVATDSRSGIEATVQVYSRLRLATEGIGLTNEQVTRTTEILAKSLSASGASASETSAALLQFSQAIGSGVLQGDELRSIRENAPAVARAIAKEFGVTVGELKKLGEEGKLTSDRVVQAVLNSGTEIDALFAKTEATVGNALTNLGNQLLNYIGQTDDSLSATERVAGAINMLADNLDKVVPAIAILATVFGARYAAGLATAALASDGFIGKSKAAVASTLADERAKTAAVAAGTRARVAAYTAESIALRAQVDTGRNAAGQFVSRARAAEALAVANRNLAGAIVPATAATVRNGTAMVAATTGARVFGSGLLALAGGPVGVAIIAVAGLVTGLNYLKDKYGDAAVAARELNEVSSRSESVLRKYEDAQIKARDATGEAAKAARASAAAYREEAGAVLQSAAALVQRRRAQALQAAQEAQEASDRADANYRRGGTSEGSRAANLGAERLAQGLRDEAARRRRQLTDAESAAQELESETNRITAGINLGGGGSGGGGGGDAGGGQGRRASGPSPEDLAALREELALANQLAIAQSRNDEAEVRRIQRLIDINDLTERFSRAQIDNARELATAQVDEVAANEAASRQVDEYLEQSERRNRRRQAAEEAIRVEQERRLQFELELARIGGDTTRIEALERELELLQRIAEYGPGRENDARRDQGVLNSARDTTRDRDRIRADADLAASSFVDTLRSGNVWESLGQRFADAAADNLQKVLSTLFQQLASQNGGSGFFADALKFTASSFGGGRAIGGPVRAGFSYDVGENGREKFVAPADGYIIPNMATANARSMGGGPLSVNINLAGANGDATIHRIAMQAARDGTAAAIAQSRTDTANDKRLSRYRMRR